MSVDLTTCEDEPIHIPGSIQAHGAILVLDSDLTVRQVSANVAEFIPYQPAQLLGQRLPEGILPDYATEVLQGSPDRRGIELLNPMLLGQLELTVHELNGLRFIELVRTRPIAPSVYQFAVGFQQGLARIQAGLSLQEVIESAVQEIKSVTGIDRVMAYRFLEGGHGKVIAEAKESRLESYLGMHYPASDIPPQARRLYALSPLRLIADVEQEPAPLVPVLHPTTEKPTDLSRATLRSVSKIHCEYLGNMGVRGSMSVSIVVDGELWGLIACHHYSPLHLSFTVRTTTHLMGQTLGVLVSQFTREEELRARQEGMIRIDKLSKNVERVRDVLAGLNQSPRELLELADADGAAVTLNARLITIGRTPSAEWISKWIAWYSSEPMVDPYVTSHLAVDYPGGAPGDGDICGAICSAFHRPQLGYVMLFRSEFRQEVKWAGNPDDGVKVGPLGARLTPRGSFELWKQTTSQQSRTWEPSARELLARLTNELRERVLEWTNDQERMRNLLVGMFGHDLRTPLGAIQMGAELLGGDQNPIARRMTNSSSRMAALLESLLDVNQIQSGHGMGLQPEKLDVHELSRGLLDEVKMAYPGMQLQSEFDGDPEVFADAPRLQQAISNLLSNARHHGDSGRIITLKVLSDGDSVRISVHNWGPVIDAEKRAGLFKEYQGNQNRSERKSGGLGLGLYIVHSIVVAHQGHVEVESSRDAGTTFTISLPRHPSLTTYS